MEQDVSLVRVVSREVITLPFHGTVAANSVVTLVSKKIRDPYRIRKFVARFALNTNRLLRLAPWVSIDDSAPTALPISGTPLLAALGSVSYVVGDDERVEVPFNADVDHGNTWLKITAENLDSWPHTVTGEIQIERREELAG